MDGKKKTVAEWAVELTNVFETGISEVDLRARRAEKLAKEAMTAAEIADAKSMFALALAAVGVALGSIGTALASWPLLKPGKRHVKRAVSEVISTLFPGEDWREYLAYGAKDFVEALQEAFEDIEEPVVTDLIEFLDEYVEDLGDDWGSEEVQMLVGPLKQALESFATLVTVASDAAYEDGDEDTDYECPHCKEDIVYVEGAEVCPYCGEEIDFQRTVAEVETEEAAAA